MQRLNFLYLETVHKTIKARAINELYPPLICYIVTAYPKLPSFAFAKRMYLPWIFHSSFRNAKNKQKYKYVLYKIARFLELSNTGYNFWHPTDPFRNMFWTPFLRSTLFKNYLEVFYYHNTCFKMDNVKHEKVYIMLKLSFIYLTHT